MDNLEHYRRKLRQLNRTVFIEQHHDWFLVKRPKPLPAGKVVPDTPNSYNPPADITTDGWFGDQWMIAEVKKRGTNPVTQFISLGRAMNCDVVLLFPGVSKLHGQFWIENGGIASFSDEGSRHGTQLNGVQLVPHEPRPVKLGDTLKFGHHLELAIRDVKGLLAVLDETSRVAS